MMSSTPIRSRPEFFGPILGWELVTLVRRGRYYIVRVAYALVLAFVLWSTFQVAYTFRGDADIQTASRFADGFFVTFVWTETFAILLLAPAFVASSIAIEKERRTIEFLFATDLTNREIIFGKLVARVMNLLSILFAGLPIVAMAGMFGGIDYARLGYVTLGLFSLLVLISSISLIVSVYARSTSNALIRSYSAVAGIIVLPALLSTTFFAILNSFQIRELFGFIPMSLLSQVIGLLTLVHPLSLPSFESFLTFAAGGVTFASITLVYAGWNLFWSAALILWAIRSLRSAYRFDESKPAEKKRPLSALTGTRIRSKPAVWEENPLLWKEFYAGRTQRYGCIVYFLLICSVLYFYGVIASALLRPSRPFRDNDLSFIAITGTIIFAGLGYIFVAFRSATSISSEKDKDSWVTLLSMPLSARQIVQSKLFVSLIPLATFALILLPAYVLAILFGDLSVLGTIIVLILMAIYGSALASVGVYQSLVRPTGMRAILVTLTIAGLACGGAHLLLLPLGLVDGDFIVFIMGTLPWAGLSVPFVPSPPSGSQYGAMVGAIFITAITYVIVSVFCYEQAVARFSEITGRIE